MTNMDPEMLREFVRLQVRQRGLNEKELEIDWDELLSAMEHPLAAEHVSESMAREPGSLQVGQPASDFSLAPLADPQAEPITLSAHFGKRPVALVFGSYT
ncbi:MAG: hypothetical protein ACE5E4_01200 [Candidatus Binatia bacterium]